MNKRLYALKRYEEIKPNHRTSFEMVYHSSNRTIALLEQLIMYDCKKYNIPTFRFKQHLYRLKKKNMQMAAKHKTIEK